jgi:hypothetical protein
MRSVSLYLLGIAAAAHVTVGFPAAAGQSAGLDACALIDAAEVMRITGRTPFPGQGPEANDPSELPANERGCHFVELQFVLSTTPSTPESFARARQAHETTRGPFKVQSVPGLGDEAYLLWDTRPGNHRSVLVVFRSGTRKVAIEDNVQADSVEATKKMLVSVAKTAEPRMK